MNSQVIPWPEEGMTVADLVKLLQTLPPTYKVKLLSDTHQGSEIDIDDGREEVTFMVEF